MQIEQLGMCMAIIKFKNFKKKCVFFVVPGNGQSGIAWNAWHCSAKHN